MEKIILDERRDTERETMLKCIKRIMFKQDLSAKSAMDELDVPEEEQDIYIEMLKKSK